MPWDAGKAHQQRIYPDIPIIPVMFSEWELRLVAMRKSGENPDSVEVEVMNFKEYTADISNPITTNVDSDVSMWDNWDIGINPDIVSVSGIPGHIPASTQPGYEVLIEVFMDRLVNQTVRWGKQWVDRRGDEPEYGYAQQEPDMNTVGGRFQYESVSATLIIRMLLGRISCAWAAIDENGCSRWLCFDSDTARGDLDKLERALKSWGLHVIREGRRPARDGHLWVLFDAPISADLLILLGDEMVRTAGIPLRSKKHPDGIEVFPKGKPGKRVGYSQVRSPFSINLKPEANGARGWFDGIAHTFRAQLEWLAQQPLNRASDAVREASKLQARMIPGRERRKQRRNFVDYGGTKRTDWWQYADDHGFKPSGDYKHGRCPSCRICGNDRSGNNMWVGSDGGIGCFRGCSYRDIERAAS